MNNERKKEFTRRISSANKGGLIVVTYEIFLEYLEESISAFKENNYEIFKDSIRKANAVVNRLTETLDFSYPISQELYPIYQFVNSKLAEAVYKNSMDVLSDIKLIMKNLYDGFLKAAEKDSSEPLMKHAQQLVAGMTYQKGALNEVLQESDNRGYRV